MDGFRWNDMKNSSSSDGTAEHELFADIPLWDEILDDRNRQPQHEEQSPVYSTFDCHRLRARQILQQEKQYEIFQKVTQPTVFIPPSQLPEITWNQISSQNQRLVLQPPKANRERNKVRKEMQVLAEKIRNRRMELGISEETVSRELNNLCRKLNMDEIYSDKGIICFEMQNMTLEYMLKMKPMLDVWIEFSSPARPFHQDSVHQDSYPSSAEVYRLSKEFNMDRKAVCNWFSNFHRKEKKKKQFTDTSNNANSSTEKAWKARNYIPVTSLEVLENSFQQNILPSFEEINNLSKELDMNRKTGYKWFVNHRYREKNNKQISNIREYLQRDHTETPKPYLYDLTKLYMQ